VGMANLKVGKSPFLKIKVGTDFLPFLCKIIAEVSLVKALFGAVTREFFDLLLVVSALVWKILLGTWNE
jgi:hypothetical protein